jgi:Holliday junction resolvase RusA-like endonuclease
MRIKNSIGQNQHNKGEVSKISYGKFAVDTSREYYLFDVIPMGAVRMTQSDRWKTNPSHPDPKKRQRKSVASYFAFKSVLKLQANLMNYKLTDVLDAVYFIPMPDSWSNKKKEQMNGMPCHSKPDLDNITKAVKDCLLEEDSGVWYEKAEKRWAYKGSIILYQCSCTNV